MDVLFIGTLKFLRQKSFLYWVFNFVFRPNQLNFHEVRWKCIFYYSKRLTNFWVKIFSDVRISVLSNVKQISINFFNCYWSYFCWGFYFTRVYKMYSYCRKMFSKLRKTEKTRRKILTNYLFVSYFLSGQIKFKVL